MFCFFQNVIYYRLFSVFFFVCIQVMWLESIVINENFVIFLGFVILLTWKTYVIDFLGKQITFSQGNLQMKTHGKTYATRPVFFNRNRTALKSMWIYDWVWQGIICLEQRLQEFLSKTAIITMLSPLKYSINVNAFIINFLFIIMAFGNSLDKSD